MTEAFAEFISLLAQAHQAGAVVLYICAAFVDATSALVISFNLSRPKNQSDSGWVLSAAVAITLVAVCATLLVPGESLVTRSTLTA